MKIHSNIKGRKQKALILLMVILAESILPVSVSALTSGPSQPEVQSFEPVGTSDMVDIFSGDFNYNIPLMDVNGYPINIAYHAGVSTDQEASWVGLGWNINVGTINRGLNGLPDDMNGEAIKKTISMKPNNTIALTGNVDLELFGLRKPSKSDLLNRLRFAASQAGKLNTNYSLGFQYNSYKGVSINWGLAASRACKVTEALGLNAGLSLGYSDNGGFDIKPSLSLEHIAEDAEKEKSTTRSFNIGSGFNSKRGVEALNLGTSTRKERTISKQEKRRRPRMGLGNAGGMFSYGSRSYTPGISTTYSGFSVDFNFRMGTQIYPANPALGLSGSYTSQYISDKYIEKPAYGYLYEQRASQNPNASHRDYLLDFNRHNDLPLMEVTPYLPWSNHTFDMFGVSAQGVGGTYRLYRNDISVVHDDFRKSTNASVRFGGEFGVGVLAKSGANVGVNYNGSSSGFWDDHNLLAGKIGAVNNASSEGELDGDHTFASELSFEPVYFKEVNELVPQNTHFLNTVGHEKNVHPKVYPKLENLSFLKLPEYRWATVNNTLYDESNTPVDIDSDKANNVADSRTPRNKFFQYLTAKDGDQCLSKKIESYELNGNYINGEFNITYTDRSHNYRRESQITEVTILAEDGSRHVFGIPAYNTKQIEKSFRVDEPSGEDRSAGIVGYAPGTNDATTSEVGLDGFYSKTETPSYAHSYLLTGVLSPDYFDLTGDGITDDDIGSAVKMNYTRTDSNFRWRTPVLQDKARYAPGLLADVGDDVGNVIYGEKEVWYLHSVEGKTHIALFKLSKRNDGLGVIDEDGGQDSLQRLYKLDSIQLFLKEDLLINGNQAVAVKTVHFEYDYTLCKGVTNQLSGPLSGKLTLKKIYFTYGGSRKGKLNAYKFSYDDENADYNLTAYDRWGTYAEPTEAPTNAEYPFSSQDQTTMDEYASMWNLNKIELPSGGVINIQYESDDYAYVQDQRAMEMFQIIGFGPDDDRTIRDVALYGLGKISKDQYDVLYFKLKDPITDPDAEEILREEYFKGIDQLQTTIYSKITESNGETYYEYIKSYCSLEYEKDLNGVWQLDCGVTDNGNTGWVRLKKEHIRDNDKGQEVNPIALSAWQYVRMNLDFLIHRGSDSKRSRMNGKPTFPVITTFVGMLGELASMATGQNKMLKTRKFCRKFQSDRSWVRLVNPNKKKLGGGHRVQQITMNDMWEDINVGDNAALNSSYGQQYDYTMADTSSVGYYNTISSGVASYEPMLGRDENPFVQPESYSVKAKGVPDPKYTFEYPIGETFMPVASVGYSQVRVSSITHAEQNVSNRTGYQVNQFYTAKDFPVDIKVSDIDKNSHFKKPGFSFGFLYGESFELAAAGQGYTIVLNDMHGKPKANYSYDENNALLSGVYYEYLTDDDGKLDNDVLTIGPDGDIEEKTLGVNVDINVDFRKMKDEFFSANVDVNLDAFPAGIIPIAIPSIYPNVTFRETNVYTAVATKVVRKIGLLKRTTAYKEGSKIHTDNLLYDGRTGAVLLTSVGNEFNDNVYNFSYPAHWVYDEGMGQAFQNWGLELKGIDFDDGVISSVHAGVQLSDYLVPGDVCMLNRSNFFIDQKVTVVESRETPYQSAGSLCLIDDLGNLIDHFDSAPLDTITTLRVIRSGRRNMASISVGSITSLSNPVKDIETSPYLSFTDVLATSAVEYKDQWRTELPYLSGDRCDTVTSDFYFAVQNALNYVIDSAYWNHLSENTIFTSAGTHFPDTVGTTGTVNRNMHFNNMDSCTQLAILNVLDSIYGADLSDLNDSIFSYQDLYPKYYDTFYNSWEVGFSLLDSTNYFDSPERHGYTYNTRGYDPYIYVSSDNVGSSPSVFDLPIFYGDLNHMPFEDCENLNIDVIATTIYQPIDLCIYSVDTSNTSSPVISILNEKNLASSNFSSGMTICGYAESFYIGFEGPDCGVYVTSNVSNLARFVELIDSTVISPSSAQIEASVYRFDESFGFDTLILDTATFTLISNCIPFEVCEEFCYAIDVSEKINPYSKGILGNWRPFKSWTYVTDRSYSLAKASPKDDGVFSTFTPFWIDAGSSFIKGTSDENWVWTSEVTNYSPYGMELENVDPLGRYSAARYGYSQTLPVAVGSNMKYEQMWYDGFEEYKYLGNLEDRFLCPQWNWVYDSTLEYFYNHGGLIDTSFSHSGLISLKIAASDSFTQEIPLVLERDTSAITNLSGKEYFTSDDDQITPFRPTPGTYLLGAWVHEDGAFNDTIYDGVTIKFEFIDDQGGIISEQVSSPTGVIIDGWQRIHQSFTIPENCATLRIKYRADSNDGWFDDVRVHPFSGNMKSYAYDFHTLRLMAEMDENNFATFYEYDLEGNLVRVKKETYDGIKTLQENRQHQKQTN